jgi:CheY-like chemotaxis protein
MSLPSVDTVEVLRGDTACLLVIDDDPVHQMVIKRVAEKAGYAIVAVTSIAEAATALERQQFHCVSLDLSLGGESGIEVLDHVARCNPETLLLVISGATNRIRNGTLAAANLLKLNVEEVPKPVDLAKLRTRLVARLNVAVA